MGWNYFFSPQGFLKIGGIVLIVIAVLGFVGIIGPTMSSVFGQYWYFDNGENWAHLVFGVIALIAAYSFPAGFNKKLVVVLGVIGVLFGLYSLFGPYPQGVMFLESNLENPLDTILHLAVGAWALTAGLKKNQMAMPMQTM